MLHFGPMTVAKQTKESPEKQVEGFIDKFEPEHQSLIRAVRKIMQKRFPSANELVYDNYNFFVIGYGPSERPSEAIFSIAAAANGVGIAFLHGATLPDPKGLLEGSGKQNRFLHIDSPTLFDRPEVKQLMAAAVAQSKVPLPNTGRGKLIIRSISAKQRPRRKPSK